MKKRKKQSIRYRFDKRRGIVDCTNDEQVIQLVGGTAKSRARCGKLLALALNAEESSTFLKVQQC
jgi:hypothetical protein